MLYDFVKMSHKNIKVYGRLKSEAEKEALLVCQVSSRDQYDYMRIYSSSDEGIINNKGSYRFDKIFDKSSTQDEIFECVGKPLLECTLEGYNSTVFAYGQTGSGKTYTVTGFTTNYHKRGLIPRTLQMLFENIKENKDKCTVSISYLEIYNEIGYDLLHKKQKFTSLEELPRVFLLEDINGEAHLKNLKCFPVSNEKEAMHLLFLGERNRTIAETANNEYSSRSHCIFTIHVTKEDAINGKILKSKFHLVDLAGSERLCKNTKLSGVSFLEAKYINLSLHFLEQVILALSETNRSHIPFRNSMLTFMLKDSLIGNSVTVLLATLSMLQNNTIETISTCRFAQRVALISLNATVNKEFEKENELMFLRHEVFDLRKKLMEKNNLITDKPLTENEKAYCLTLTQRLLNEDVSFSNENDPRILKKILSLITIEIKKNCKLMKRQDEIGLTNSDDVIEKYKQIIKQKDEEISILNALLENKVEPEWAEENKPTESALSCLSPSSDMKQQESIQKTIFMAPKRKIEIEFYLAKLEEKCLEAHDLSRQIQIHQINISQLKSNISRCTECERDILQFQLRSEQNNYKELLFKMENLKLETEYLKTHLNSLNYKFPKELKKQFKVKKEYMELIPNIISDHYVKHLEMQNSDIYCNSIKSSLNKNINNNLSLSPKESDDCGKSFLPNNLKHLENNDTKSSRLEIAEINRKLDRLLKETIQNVPTKLDEPKKQSIEIKDIEILNNKLDTLLNKSLSTSNSVIDGSKLNNGISYYECNPLRGDKVKQLDISETMAKIHSLRNNLPNIFEKHTVNVDSQELRYNIEQSVIESGDQRVRRNISSIPNTENSDENICSSHINEETKLLNIMDGSRIASNDQDFQDVNFQEFMKSIPLTGDRDVDDEIIKFYRLKFNL